MLSAEDERLLVAAIQEGRVVLILGAGASATSQNRINETVLQSKALAKHLATMAGLTYSNEELPEVLGAVLGRRISPDQFNGILEREYTGISPSVELAQLLDFTWCRLYTWNVDDALDNVKGGVQRRRIYNGMGDKVHPPEGLEYLQTIYLHGRAVLPEHGFIFSRADYSDRLNRDTHDWYRALAADYSNFVPVFVGNPFALHAYADLQLQVAARRPSFDARTVELLDDAVKTLEDQNANSSWKSDQYPLVTLCEKYLWALIKHGQMVQAREAAARYFRQIEELSRQSSAEPVRRARQLLAVFLATGRWNVAEKHGPRRQRRK